MAPQGFDVSLIALSADGLLEVPIGEFTSPAVQLKLYQAPIQFVATVTTRDGTPVDGLTEHNFALRIVEPPVAVTPATAAMSSTGSLPPAVAPLGLPGMYLLTAAPPAKRLWSGRTTGAALVVHDVNNRGQAVCGVPVVEAVERWRRLRDAVAEFATRASRTYGFLLNSSWHP